MKIKQLNEITQVRISLKVLPFSVSFYEIDGLLIDTGPPSHKKKLQAYFKEKSFEQVVLTHHHEDHSGLAGWLAREKHIPILMLAETKQILQSPYKIPFYRLATWGQMDPVQGEAVENGATIETNRYQFKVIHTPGHCYDHISLLEPYHGYLFSGDLYVSNRIKYSLQRESLRDMLRSINTLLAEDFEYVYCAHAGFIKHGRQAFENKKAYIEELIGTVLHDYEQGLDLKEIRAKLHPQIDWRHLFSRGEFSSYNVVRSIIEEFCDPL